MNSEKSGKLIAKIRKDKNMTQKEVADRLHISDKTVSKWERGQGCPDIALLGNLANVLGVNIDEILSGEMITNANESGNMKKTKFYVCPTCGNVITSTSELLLTCCGKKLTELVPDKGVGEGHTPKIEFIEDDIYVTLEHEMDKKHFISFMAYVTSDKLYINKLYPEQNAETRFRWRGHGLVYVYCNKHGLSRKIV